MVNVVKGRTGGLDSSFSVGGSSSKGRSISAVGIRDERCSTNIGDPDIGLWRSSSEGAGGAGRVASAVDGVVVARTSDTSACLMSLTEGHLGIVSEAPASGTAVSIGIGLWDCSSDRIPSSGWVEVEVGVLVGTGMGTSGSDIS
ncbi:hypothetical protein ABW19_dt0205272 [Dactylella cylindrospora]|nr:hypothetical protein ABW19_dt0205272 [Dactylella cylindrospora]